MSTNDQTEESVAQQPPTLLDDESAARWLLLLLLGIALLYAPLLLADYAWDDEALVLARTDFIAEGGGLPDPEPSGTKRACGAVGDR